MRHYTRFRFVKISLRFTIQILYRFIASETFRFVE